MEAMLSLVGLKVLEQVVADFYVVKLDSSGKCYSGQRLSAGVIGMKPGSIIQSSDGGYVVAGWTVKVLEQVVRIEGYLCSEVRFIRKCSVDKDYRREF
jgi:hypothetical protein